jgi:hypothetical protein
MRPAPEMQRLRSVGRILAVATGALAAIALVRVGPLAAVYGVAANAPVAGAAGTHRSRWYVTPAFTSFLVFLLLLHGHPEDAAARFGERLLETLLGVGIAYAFAWRSPRDRSDATTTTTDLNTTSATDDTREQARWATHGSRFDAGASATTALTRRSRRTSTRSAGGDSRVLAKEQSWRTT